MAFNRNDWEATWKDLDNGLAQNNLLKLSGIDGQYHEAYTWVKGKEIRVFKEPQVAAKAVSPVVNSLKELVDEIGLNLHVNYYGNDAGLNRQIEQCTAVDMARKADGEYMKVLDGDLLARHLIAEDWRKIKPHADVVITDKYLKLGPHNWGQSAFYEGVDIISVPGARQDSLSFLYNVSKHEGGHLLGYGQHHDSTQAQVMGYDEPRDCLMYWRASTDELCNKCKNAMVFFWESLEDGMNDSFFEKYPILILQ